ncbi:class I lanthipeptide [Myxococcus sp. Y35]|uniref:class I lanthipeptide n=1 Tax=Pseudomyxococcus flavus TaxID=3115648 RepID=UPI003CF8F7AB
MNEMNAQASKKLSLKKETLRPLNESEMGQLDGAVGGVSLITITTGPSVTITITTMTITETVVER